MMAFLKNFKLEDAVECSDHFKIDFCQEETFETIHQNND